MLGCLLEVVCCLVLAQLVRYLTMSEPVVIAPARKIMYTDMIVIESTQSKLYAHWFAGSNLAFVYGLDIAWSRLTTIISRSSAVPMSMLHGWWGWALW